MRNRLFGYFVIAIQIQILTACSADPAPAPPPPEEADATEAPPPPPAAAAAIPRSSAPSPITPITPITLSAEDLEICKARAARASAGAVTADAELGLADVRDVLVNEMSGALTLTFTFRPTRDGKDEHWSYRTIEIMSGSTTANDQAFSVGRHEQLAYLSTTTGVGCGQSGDYEACGASSSDGLPKLNLIVTSRTNDEIDGELEIPDATTGKVLHAGFQALLHAPKEPGDGRSICCVTL